ncbi:hypothetical protein J40TS1_37160 [Paenibacillus montaniterrae]|uniref:Uncharacterized protein n=1 Tax=Paenibacillus montaniterrae TaxID=429341 RepID=A0A919YTH2_9BACL|nr:hypothetical protein J40TS1_37160 [Paenibacillus montaniterrae]
MIGWGFKLSVFTDLLNPPFLYTEEHFGQSMDIHDGKTVPMHSLPLSFRSRIMKGGTYV